MYPKWYKHRVVVFFAILLFSLVAVSLLGSVAQAEDVDVSHTLNSSPTPTIQTLFNSTPTPTVYSPLTISGRVVDENGNPLGFVQVSSQPYLGQSSDRTDDQGYYTLRNVQPGTYQVMVQYSYLYEPESHTVSVPPNAVNVDFQKLSATATPASPTPTNTPTATGTPVTVDSGFRLNEHAWRFPNRAFVPEDKHILGAFGADNARRFAGVVFSDGTGGSCFGFAVTASLLVHGNSLGLTPPVSPFVNTFSVPDPGEKLVGGYPYFLNQDGVADYIIQSHYRQFSSENWDEMKMSHRMSLEEKINSIKQSVDDSFNSDPVIIALQNRSDDCGGHVVVPISYTVSLDGRTEVGVYDPNHPVGMNEQQSIIFDESNESWSYIPRGESVSYGSTVVCTNANNQRLKSKIEVLHATTYSRPTNPPFLRMPPRNIWIEVSNWVVSVRDAAGNVLGDVGGEIVENIPNSFVFTPLDQLGGNPKSWYVVQTATPVTATIQYSNSIDDAITLFAQKAVFDVGLAKSGTATDTLVIDSSGGAVSLFGSESREITTTRSLTGTEQIFTLNLQKSDEVSVQMLDDGSLKFFTATAQNVVLTLVQHGGDGEASYQLSLPPFNAGDAQIITPQWQNNAATVSTDTGNDGTVDSTQTLQGETKLQAVYLPLIKR